MVFAITRTEAWLMYLPEKIEPQSLGNSMCPYLNKEIKQGQIKAAIRKWQIMSIH